MAELVIGLQWIGIGRFGGWGIGLECDTYNDGDVQHHIRNIGGFGRPLRINKLAYRCAERIRQTGDSSCAGSATIREPEITISCRCTETEGLREADEDLAEHC